MTEWDVIGVIIALAGLLAVLVPPIIKLNGSIVKLTEAVSSIMKGLEDFKGRYTNQLDKQSHTNEKLFDQLDNHEHRITVLETHDTERDAR